MPSASIGKLGYWRFSDAHGSTLDLATKKCVSNTF